MPAKKAKGKVDLPKIMYKICAYHVWGVALKLFPSNNVVVNLFWVFCNFFWQLSSSSVGTGVGVQFLFYHVGRYHVLHMCHDGVIVGTSKACRVVPLSR